MNIKCTHGVLDGYCSQCAEARATEPWDRPPVKTVGELRAALDGVPDDMLVIATWEGIYRLLAPEGEQDVPPNYGGRAFVFDVEWHEPDITPV